MKLPMNAKKVFSGILYDVYQWEQELFDGTTATFEGLKRADTVQIIATQGQKVLISDEEQPYIGRRRGFLGGRVESGEDLFVAAKRELLEETGLVSDEWLLYKTLEVPGRVEWNIHYLIARNCRQYQQPKQDVGERITVKAVSWDEFLRMVEHGELAAGHDLSRVIGWTLSDSGAADLHAQVFPK